MDEYSSSLSHPHLTHTFFFLSFFLFHSSFLFISLLSWYFSYLFPFFLSFFFSFFFFLLLSPPHSPLQPLAKRQTNIHHERTSKNLFSLSLLSIYTSSDVQDHNHNRTQGEHNPRTRGRRKRSKQRTPQPPPFHLPSSSLATYHTTWMANSNRDDEEQDDDCQE